MYTERIIEFIEVNSDLIMLIAAHILFIVTIYALDVHNFIFQIMLYVPILIFLIAVDIINIKYLFIIAIFLIAYIVFIMKKGQGGIENE